MTDLPVWDLGFLLRANANNPEFRERDRMMTIVLTNFLQKEKLLRWQMLSENEEPPLDFVIMESDLAAEGAELFRALSIDRWARANEDIRKPISMRSLERSLKKLRSLG